MKNLFLGIVAIAVANLSLTSADAGIKSQSTTVVTTTITQVDCCENRVQPVKNLIKRIKNRQHAVVCCVVEPTVVNKQTVAPEPIIAPEPITVIE